MRRMKLKRRKVVSYLVVLACCYWLYRHCLPLYLDLAALTGGSGGPADCPACYGTNLCSAVASGDLVLESGYDLTLYRLFNVKNVFRATWKSRNISVVLKALATDKELRKLDETICEYNKEGGECQPGKVMHSLATHWSKQKSDLQGLSEGELSRVTLDWEKLSTIPRLQAVDLLQCTRSQDKIDLLVHRSLHHPAQPHLPHLLTLLLLQNPEPIVAMTFPGGASRHHHHQGGPVPPPGAGGSVPPPRAGGSVPDGPVQQSSAVVENSALARWPFPLYFGSCGRLAVFEDVGASLASYYRHPWLVRAHFAHQLLVMARKFSGTEEGLALYPTDWAASNFAVDAATGTVFLVDLENIIIVNQTLLKQVKAPGWDTPHNADRYGCSDCFSFSTEDLCTHVQTDHNYHGVCGGLLAYQPYSPDIPFGLLHTTPPDILDRHPLILRLVQQCWETTAPGGREEAVNLLLEILESELSGVDILKLLNSR